MKTTKKKHTETLVLQLRLINEQRVSLDRLEQSLMAAASEAGIKPTDIPMGHKKPPRCVQVWTNWLRGQGPHPRTVIQENTNVAFSGPAYEFTEKWDPRYEFEARDYFAPDTIMRIREPRKGDTARGGGQVIFFLWSQRFDLYDRYGVGPMPMVTLTDEAAPATTETQ